MENTQNSHFKNFPEKSDSKYIFWPNNLYPQRFRVRFWCQFRNWNPFSLKVNIGLGFFVCGMAYFIKEIYRKYTGKSRKYTIIVLWWEVFIGNRFFRTDPLFMIVLGLYHLKFDANTSSDPFREHPKGGKIFCHFWHLLGSV